MGKFLLGIVIGLVLGVLAMAYNPGLPEDVRTAFARVTGLVLRGTEEAAEKVGKAADEVAKEAREATDPEETPSPPPSATEGAQEPAAPTEPGRGEPARTE